MSLFAMVECRLYAEDPLNDFLPAPGKLIKWIPANVEVICVSLARENSSPSQSDVLLQGVRFDMGIQSGSEITMHYDPMVVRLSLPGFDFSVPFFHVLSHSRSYRLGEDYRLGSQSLSGIAADAEGSAGNRHCRPHDERAVPPPSIIFDLN